MHPFPYVILRLIRHFLPESITRFLLRRNLIIHPGRDTAAPKQSVDQYIQELRAHGISPAGKHILVFGYGGSFAVAAELLGRGAAHVTLCDKFAPPNEYLNTTLITVFPRYFHAAPEGIRPSPEFISLYQADIRDLTDDIQPVDIVVSTSVYEHLPAGEVDSITAALAKLTRPGGIGIHFIDLRDHYFKYPFEMLTFSEPTWRKWLNPTSNLNRYRFRDYVSVFEKHFLEIKVEILERDYENFQLVSSRIRPEFLSNDIQLDTATLIKVICI